MKKLLVLLSLSLSSAALAVGWEELIAHQRGERELAKAPVVSLMSDRDGEVLVEVENRTGSDLQYSGYSKSSPQLFFKKRKGTTWVAEGWHWCGTGMSAYTLKDRRSVVFKLHRGDGDETRAFTVFRDARDRSVFSLIRLF